MGLKRRYIIFAPIWHSHSAGLVVIQKLMNALIRKDYDCIYYPFGAENVARNEISDNDVVIYPEIVIGNPLNAKNVVRWLLNYVGVIGGDGKYGEHDMVFQYSPKYKHPMVIGLLSPSFLDDFFFSDNRERKDNYIWTYKGAWKKRIPIAGIEHTPNSCKTRYDLAEKLRGCKILYTYDDNTALAYEARACGCEVMLINADGSIVPYLFEEQYWNEFPQQLQKFIEITQNAKNNI